MSAIVKWNGASSSLRRLEATLAQDRSFPLLPPTRRQEVIRPDAPSLPPRVDLLRLCAQHEGNPWAAIYLLNANGGYEYSTSIAVSKTLARTQYAPGVAKTFVWDSRWIDEEVCALCGVASPGPVRCGSCHNLVCRGRSTGRYFRCFCGAADWLQTAAIEHIGVIPQLSG